MSKSIQITDDGDEVVFVKVVDYDARSGKNSVIETIELDHDLFGWAGMEAGIERIKRLASALDVPVVDTQDVV